MKKALITLGAVLILALAWWLGSPLFLDKSVDEALPFAEMTNQEYQEMVEAGEDVDVNVPSMDEMKQMTQEDMKDLEEEMAEASKNKEDVMVEDTMPSEPVVAAQGTFRDGDSFHMGSGTATIYTLPDGSQILRFEDFSVTNGPDLRVLLAVDGDVSESVELGKLKGNLGNQNYEIDPSIDLSKYNTAIIYCKPFHVTFSTAALQ